MAEKLKRLQLFAEGDSAGANDGTNQAQGDESKAKDNKLNESQGDGEKNKGENKAKYTDGDLDKIIEKKLAEAKKKHEKAVDEAKKLAEMNAQQKAEYERDELQKELDSYRKESNLTSMTKVAREMLNAEDISLPDNLLSLIVSDSADSTKKTVDSFISTFKKAVESQVKKAVGGQAPKKNSNSKMTKEQIMAVKDSVERQKLIAANISMFH